MIPPRPTKPAAKIPPRPDTGADWIEFQPNRLFSSDSEMREWLDKNSPGAIIVKHWSVKMLACVVKIPAPKKNEGKKK